MSDIEEALRATIERLADLEGRLERMHRYGTVLADGDVDVSDPTKPRARIYLGDDDDDGQPVKTPWLPYATIAGARNTHSAPSPGQQFLLIAPDGEHQAGLLIPLGHSNNVPSPSTDPKNYVDQAGATTTQFKDGKHDTKVGTQSEHLIVDGAQRIAVKDISQLVIRLGTQAFNLSPNALVPAQDIPDY